MPKPFPFLRAEWRSLLFLNYEVEADVLLPLLPAGTELDLWQGRPVVSIVGLLFRNTRVLGVKVPFFQRFEQINLRFYVRAGRGTAVGETAGGDATMHRGVVFIKEIIPRFGMARAARLLGENYHTLPTGSTVETKGGSMPPGGLVEYTFRTPRRKWGILGRRINRMGALAGGEIAPLQPVLPLPGSEEEFVTARHWSFTRRGPDSTLVMKTEHPQWRVLPVTQPYLLCDVRTAYGEAFEPFLRRRPQSALLAEGSPVSLLLGYPDIG